MVKKVIDKLTGAVILGAGFAIGAVVIYAVVSRLGINPENGQMFSGHGASVPATRHGTDPTLFNTPQAFSFFGGGDWNPSNPPISLR